MTLLALSAASWIGLSVVVALVFGVVMRTVDRHEAALRSQRLVVVPGSGAGGGPVPSTPRPAVPDAPPEPAEDQPARLTVVA